MSPRTKIIIKMISNSMNTLFEVECNNFLIFYNIQQFDTIIQKNCNKFI